MVRELRATVLIEQSLMNVGSERAARVSCGTGDNILTPTCSVSTAADQSESLKVSIEGDKARWCQAE
jgi:hypothetical protein